MASRLTGLEPATTPVLVFALVFQVVVVAASWLPALKASRVDPLVALRAE